MLELTFDNPEGSVAVIETVNQAMNALDAYWAKHGTPDTRVIAPICRKLEERSSSCDDDWKALLDEAMRDLGYSIEWKGNGVHTVTQQGDGLQGLVGSLQPAG